MNMFSFLIWVTVIGAIALFAVISMAQAYVGKGSLALVFSEPLSLPTPTLNSEAATQFQQGCSAFQAKKYGKAADYLAAAIQLDSSFAEAYHNRGRAIANLRKDNEAANTLVKAGELYLQQDNTTGYEQVKQDLKLLKQKRLEERTAKEGGRSPSNPAS
jgi:thioredoxin-like negative regulator of GroEL